ncbi:MAG: hypothetical protein ACWGNV_10500 [Bacteroidales bacterium]
MKRIVWILLLTGLVISAEAQPKTYLTVEGGPQWSMLKVSDPAGYFRSTSVMSAMAGVSFSQEFVPNFSIGAGLYYQPYRDGIHMNDDRPNQSRWAAYDALLIPVRLEYRVYVPQTPVSLTPRVGYVYGILSFPESPFAASGILSAPDGTPFTYSLDHTYSSESLHLMEAGLGINLHFSGNWLAAINLSYMTGFSDPFTMTLEYSNAGSDPQAADYTSHGNSLSASLAVGIPVSDLWQNRDYRIASRIEQSSFAGKPISRKGNFYVGAEAGSLWRLFHTTNPAIGDRPMTDRGLFRYANFHGGIYIGYMFTNELGVDVGANYQRSSNFFTVMVDHEDDMVTKLPAPMFLEVPLRVRYLYNLWQEKLYLAVYGGASLLTHFTSGVYNQSAGSFLYTSPVSNLPEEATLEYYGSRPSRLRPLLRAGTGLEYRLPLGIPLYATLYVNYMQGFISAEDLTITTSLPETPTNTVISYNGEGWSIDLGIKLPLRFKEGAICVPLPERTE